MEEALGASFTGARAIVTMKHVGLNVAADPLFSASYIGVTGALVIVSADDPGMHSSQNEQDNRHYAIAAKMPVLEPSDSQEAKDMVIEAVKISETFDTPVMIRMTTRTSHSRSAVELGERQAPPVPEYKSDFAKRNLLPGNARKRHAAVEERLKKLAVFSDSFAYNVIIKGRERVGVLASGVSYQYGREVFPDAWFLKLALPYPFPVKLFQRFAAMVDKIYVLEENDPIIETFARLAAPQKEIIGKDVFPLQGELSQDVVRASLGLKDLTPRFDGDGRARAAALALRRLPAHRLFLQPRRAEGAVPRRHRLLHPGRPAAAERHGHLRRHGGQHHRAAGHRESPGKGGQVHQAGGGDRRFHLFPLRHHRPDRRHLQPGQVHGGHPGQLHHGHDRPPGEPRLGQDADGPGSRARSTSSSWCATAWASSTPTRSTATRSRPSASC